MKKKFHMTFGLKMILLAAGMSVAISAAALLSGYLTFFFWNVSSYISSAQNLLHTLRIEVPVEVLDEYSEHLDLSDPAASQADFEPDERYNAIEEFIIDTAMESGARAVYIARVEESAGLVILFDSDNENQNYTEKGFSAFGTTYNSPDIEASLDEMAEAVEIGTIIDGQDHVLTVYIPYLRAGGISSGYYAMVDFSLAHIMNTQRSFTLVTSILLGFLTVIFLGIYLLVIHRSFIRPLRSITKAAQSCGAGAGPEAFDDLKFKGSYELRTLADSFRDMLTQIRDNNQRKWQLAVQEQTMKNEMELANDLNLAVLPKQLPQREEDYPFRVQGRIDQGEGLTCCFYDYFLLPGDRLCIMVGETPGSGISQVLFTVMAQAAIKSRLMSDLSLMETMTSANRQLYEMGGNMYLNALVGILDGATGSFTYINAGLSVPLLKRSQRRYEPMEAFSYASLGQNENVTYRVIEVKLDQGDRLFFHSENADGNRNSYTGERLCQTLNQAKVSRADLETQLQMLESVSDQEQTSGRAMLALEYCRRDKANAHCVLTNDAAGASTLQRFLQEQMRANQIDERQVAQLIVLGDELFSLCRRAANSDSRYLAECAIRQDTVVLRIRGDMGGRDPMADRTEGPTLRAVEYIKHNSEQVYFAHDDFSDAVTLVKRIL